MGIQLKGGKQAVVFLKQQPEASGHHIGQGQLFSEFTHWAKRRGKPFKTDVLKRSRLMALPPLNAER
jgi:hypothetical protein